MRRLPSAPSTAKRRHATRLVPGYCHSRSGMLTPMPSWVRSSFRRTSLTFLLHLQKPSKTLQTGIPARTRCPQSRTERTPTCPSHQQTTPCRSPTVQQKQRRAIEDPQTIALRVHRVFPSTRRRRARARCLSGERLTAELLDRRSGPLSSADSLLASPSELKPATPPRA